jgi:hypothetical protein
MARHLPHVDTQFTGIRTGQNTPPRETVPQGTVKPNSRPLQSLGPANWEDLVLHTGEARGVADTAYHSLEPDAPTAGAARRGQEFEQDVQ